MRRNAKVSQSAGFCFLGLQKFILDKIVMQFIIDNACECGGTAYTTDLKSVGETLGVQIPPFAPKKRICLMDKCVFLSDTFPCGNEIHALGA